MEIQKGIPMPKKREAVHMAPPGVSMSEIEETMARMMPGDSFAVEVRDRPMVSVSITRLSGRAAPRWSIRSYKGGLRCWRVA